MKLLAKFLLTAILSLNVLSAYASCTTTSTTYGGTYITCTTCCFNGSCHTTCF
jgi:hypothetical protein